MASTHQAPGPMTPDEARVIVASSLGTVPCCLVVWVT